MTSTFRIAAFLLLVSFRLHAASLENAAESLGDNNFTKREQAEIDLKKAGFEALALIDPLLVSEDPEIAFRARRIHNWIICGIDERIPAEIASDLPHFDTLPADRQTAVIKEIVTLDPPHISALTSLHSRLFEMPLPDGQREQLLATVEEAMRSTAPVENLAQFSPWPLDIRTRAFLINLATYGQATNELKETYKAWQKQQPDLRSYLDSRSVLLEVDLLRAEWDKQSALAFVAEIRGEQAFKILVKEFRDWMLGDPELKFDELGEIQAIAYLELTFESATPGDALPLFKKLRDRIPELIQKLRPQRSTPILALQLWESGKQAEAAGMLYPEGKEIRDGVEYLGQMILDSDHFDFAEVIASITHQSAGKLVKIMLREPIFERGIERAINLSAYLRTSGNNSHNSPLEGASAQSLALDLWKNGRDDLCYRVMEEAFWNWDDNDEWRLSYFPALASAMGRLDDAIAASETVPAEARKRDLKIAYLYRAAGRTAEALEFSSQSPESHLHQLLLIETRNWSALAPTSKNKRHLADWFACLNGDRETWRGNVPEPEKKSAHLLLMLDEHFGLFSKALKSDGGGVSGAQYARVLAGDFLLSKLLREEIVSSIDHEHPIPWKHVEYYFQYPDRIPDKDAAVQLALRLAKVKAPLSTDEYHTHNDDEPPDIAHKAMLFKALLALGHSEHAKKLAHDTFGEDFELEALSTTAQANILSPIVGSAWRARAVLQKLARWELPDSQTIDRLFYLKKLLDQPNQAEKVSAVLALAERHTTQLSDEELTSLLSTCSRMLDRPALADKFSEFPKKEALVAFSRSLHKIPVPPVAAEKHKVPTHEIMRPEVGELSAPKADEFAILDGLTRAHDNWKGGESEAAQTQLLDIVIRIILDEDFSESSISADIRKGDSTSSGSYQPAELLMIGFLSMDLPEELCLPATGILSQLCLKPSKIYISKDFLDATAQAFAHQSDYENACRIYHRYCALDLDADFHYRDIQTTAYLVELEIRRALASGRTSEAVKIYERHHRLLPFNMELTDHILATLRAAKEPASAEKLNQIITGFWEKKIKKLPNAKAYRETLSHWKMSFSAS